MTIDQSHGIAPGQYWYLEHSKVRPVNEQNMYRLYRLPDGISRDQCKRVIERVLETFPALRSQFNRKGDTWFYSTYPLSRGEAFLWSQCDRDSEVVQFATELSPTLKPLVDIHDGLLVVFNFIECRDSGRIYLLLSINHIIYDFFSINVLINAFRLFFSNPEAVITCRYAEWVSDLHAYIDADEDRIARYWLEQKWDLAGALNLPRRHSHVDPGRWFRKKAVIKGFRGVAKSLAALWHVELLDVLLTIVARTMEPFTASGHVTISAWENGRNISQNYQSIGLFAYFWPLLIKADEPFELLSHAIRRTRTESTRKASFLHLMYGPSKRREAFSGFPDSHVRVDYLGIMPAHKSDPNGVFRYNSLSVPDRTITKDVNYATVEFFFKGDDLYAEWDFPSFFHDDDQLEKIFDAFCDVCNVLAAGFPGPGEKSAKV